jgi:hypothetical protein
MLLAQGKFKKRIERKEEYRKKKEERRKNDKI